MSKSEIEAAFYTQAQAHSGTNFQSWFKGIGEVLHEGSEFSEVTQTQGDGGLDFVVISQGIVYQVYGPQDRVTDAKLAKKVTDDFPKAINTMGDNLKVWRLLINQRGTGLGKKSTAVLAKLTDKHSEVGMSVWWLDRLWDELMLPAEKSQARLMKLAKILGVSGFKPDYVEQSDKLHIEAQELCNAGNAKEAFDKAKEALSLIKHHADAEAILRALSILIIIGSQLRVESSLQRYGEEMEKYFPQVSNDKLLVNYYRAKSILARIACDPVQERAAIEQGMALLEKLDGDFALVQFCVFCVNLIGLACREKDFELAQQWTSKAMDRLNAYRGEEHDPLLLELTHVRIWCAVLAKDEAELAACVRMLDEHGNGSEIAERFAEALANNAGQLRHDKFPKVAQQAAQAALRLAHKLHMKENFILGVTYNLAVAKCECGDIDGGKASLKPLLNLPASQQNDMLKGAAMQLLSIIEREAGRFEQSVNYGQDALVHIADAREQIFIKHNLAKSLTGIGKFKDAIENFQDAWHLAQNQEKFPSKTLIEIAGSVGVAAAQIGWQEKYNWALACLESLAQHDAEHCSWYQEQMKKYADLQQRIKVFATYKNVTKESIAQGVFFFSLYADLNKENSSKPVSKPVINTVAQANAQTISPLITWWKDTIQDPGAAAIDLDYWGRGGFAQILNNMCAFPSAFNVILEVRSVQEIRAIAKLWGLYADFILLIWKGETETGDCLASLDAEFFGPWGAGYTMALGSTTVQASGRRRSPTFGYATRLPEKVIQFMQTEAHELIAAGKLLVVPASVVGCISPGWGPMEQGIAEAANAIPGTRAKLDEVIGIASLPYSPNLPFSAMLEFTDKYETDLLEIRKNLAQHATTYRQSGNTNTDERLQRDIHDMLKMAEAKQRSDNISKNIPIAKENIGLGTSPFRNGLRLDARSDEVKSFEPLLVLQSMGYGWEMGRLDGNDQQSPYKVTKGETVGAWLCPPLPGTIIPTIKIAENS